MQISPKEDALAHNIVIFDFSGTLSFEAVMFAQIEPLVATLKESGLWQLGLNNPKILWHEVISPTWNVSSTTNRSFREIMGEKIIEVLDVNESNLLRTIDEGVSHFINSYFKAAQIAPEWEVILNRLLQRPDTLVVIATDHYLEVTQHIQQQLARFGIKAAPVFHLNTLERDRQQVFIANSAEIGARKAKRVFWSKLHSLLPLNMLSMVILVDDFGANEPLAWSANLEIPVNIRIERANDHIADIFKTRTEIFPFFVENGPIDMAGFRTLVEAASQFIAHQVFGEQSP